MKSSFFLLPCVALCGLLSHLDSPAFGQTDRLVEQSFQEGFHSPPRESHPETWFHLIGGNVNREALSKDLNAIKNAGIGGVQLFHGKGRPWPGVKPQIQTLSPTWDSLISSIADEAKRLELNFTMQNCPGWAMSGGPWITPDRAMRHLIYHRQNLAGGERIAIKLQRPQPSEEAWRDYQDVAVLAFPTPAGDTGDWLKPTSVRSSTADPTWADWLAGKDVKIQIPVGDEPAWLEFNFAEPVTLRSIELPPIEQLMKRVSFDPDCQIAISIPSGDDWTELIRHEVPRGTWQDRQPEHPVVMAVPDATSKRYRLIFHNGRPMEISQLRLSSSARLHDWRAQAGYALRSLERAENPQQSIDAWVQQESVIDLTDQLGTDGQFTWDAPAGDWTVVRFGHVNTGVKNKPAPPEATGFECDKLSPAGAEQHFAGYIGRLSKPGGAVDGGRLNGMLIDSWECYTQTWTPKMEQEFEQRRGYALRTWLPALAGWVMDDHQTSERFLRDWRATVSDLIVEHYFGRMAELGRERGLKISFETAVGDVSPGDILEYFKSADVPMCEFWQPNDPHLGGLETKPVAPTASAAHIYGKSRVAAEGFTSAPMNWREHPFALKNYADRAMALGVTHVVFHTYTHNPLDRVPGTSFGNRIGTPFLRGQTWWGSMPQFTDYLARCSYMLEQGKPVADVLWYLGDDVDHKPRQDSAFPAGYHFDYLNADALINRLSVDDGKLVTADGTSWRVLWLPRKQCRRMTHQTLVKIKELLNAGATVIGEAPDLNASLSGGKEAEQIFKSCVADLWGPAPNKQQGERRIGKGRLLWGDKLADSLAKVDVSPDVSGIASARWCHRRVGDTDLYFVTGDRLQPMDANLHFRAQGAAEFWNPIDGSTTPVTFRQTTKTGTRIPMQLPVAGSVFVVFRPEKEKPSYETVSRNGNVLIDASDEGNADTAVPFPTFGIAMTDPIQPWVKPSPTVFETSGQGTGFVAWQDGKYQFRDSDAKTNSIDVTGTKTISLQGDWSLSFPPDWDAPDRIEIDNARPWSEMADQATRHFSGTAVYEKTFSLEKMGVDDRFELDLGRVGVIADVTVNGKQAGVVWAQPFRQDVTDYLKVGENQLKISVTNTWHNRLALDASLPKPKQKTWTYSAPKANSSLDYSGLGGNVQLRVGKRRAFPAN